jgi:F0F1-type ATP synthase membrane subunit b/b'
VTLLKQFQQQRKKQKRPFKQRLKREVKTKAAELLNGLFNKRKSGRYHKNELTAKRPFVISV